MIFCSKWSKYCAHVCMHRTSNVYPTEARLCKYVLWQVVHEYSICVRYGLFISQLVRLVANLSVHPEAGPSITQDRGTIDNLLRILGQ